MTHINHVINFDHVKGNTTKIWKLNNYIRSCNYIRLYNYVITNELAAVFTEVCCAIIYKSVKKQTFICALICDEILYNYNITNEFCSVYWSVLSLFNNIYTQIHICI